MEPQNNLIQPTNKNHRILILTISILLTAAVIGGGTYYVLNQQIKKQNDLITELEKSNKKIEDKKEVAKTGEKKTEAPVVKDETADWKTYINTEYSYIIKYPQDWQYLECLKTNVQFIYPGQKAAECNSPDLGQPSIIVDIGDIEKDPAIPALTETQVDNFLTFFSNTTKDKISIIGLTAYKTSGYWKSMQTSTPPEGTRQADVQFQKNKQIFKITYRKLKSQENKEAIFEKMLNTFKLDN